MKVLVTGGCGFIGSNLVPLLLNQGHDVRVLDNLNVGKKGDLAGLDIEIRVGDIRDADSVKSALDGMDAVVHLAAHTSVIDSQKEPFLDFDINVRGTLNLLLGCRDLGIGNFVLASSNAPIGETLPPIDETKPPRPLSPYGASKLACEGYCSAFHGSYGLKSIILRFANVYGPRSSHKGSVVAQFIKDALDKGQITIYGDGEQTRDLIYVEDLCRAIMTAIESDCGGETFQIATGKETSVNQLAEMTVSNLPDRVIDIVHVEQRAGEIIKNYSSIEKACRLLRWEPQVSLSKGLSTTVRWFLDTHYGG